MSMLFIKKGCFVATWAFLFGAVCLLPVHCVASELIFLKLTGINGEATHANFVNQIVVTSFSEGVSNASSLGGGGSVPQFSKLTITKSLDTASPVLYEDCATGAPITQAVLSCVEVTTAGDKLFYTITLNNVTVTGVQTAGAGGGGSSRPEETVTLSFTAIKWKYQQLDGNGNPVGSPVTHSFNLATDKGS